MVMDHDRTTFETIDQSRLLRWILNSMGDGVIVLDRGRACQLFNPRAREIFGIGEGATPGQWTDDWLGSYGGELLLPDGQTPYPPSEFPLLLALRGEKIDRCESRLRRRSPSAMVRLSITARPLVDEDGVVEGSVAVIRDLSACVESQPRAEPSQRPSTIGEMVAGVVHESRNVLQQIQACSALLRWRLEGDQEGLDLVADLQRAQERLLHIFEDIRSCAVASSSE
jgi:hypothetical protein